MKPYRILIAALLVFFSGEVTLADNSNTLAMKHAVGLFIDAFSHGEFKEFENILDKNAKLTMSRGSSITTYNKSEIIRILEPLKNVDQNCETNSIVLEDLPGQMVVKVTMKYKTFTRENYITMSKIKGWKITNISSMFS